MKTLKDAKIGDTVKISYVDQNRAGLDPNKNLWEAVSDGNDFIEVGGVEVPTRAYVASFGFKGSDQQKLTGVLSGGERNRLNLALTLKQGGNLLLLDEHTAALDPKTADKVLQITEEIVARDNLTTMMVTHNMRDAIAYGNRLIMMHEGKVIYDVAGEEKKNLQVKDLLAKFEEVSGGEFANDRMMLA